MEIEHLTVGSRMRESHENMAAKLPCYLSCLSWAGYYLTHQVTVHSNNPLSHGSAIYICDQVQVGPKRTSKLREGAAKAHGFYSYYNAICCQACTYSFMGWALQLVEEESRSWFTDGSAHYPGTIQKWTVVALYPLSETTLKETPMKKNLHSEQNFGQYTRS